MILTATRGQSFREPFTFKDANGRPAVIPQGSYRLILEHAPWSAECGSLARSRGELIWSLTEQEVADLPYSTVYFRLTFNGEELARGVLRVN